MNHETTIIIEHLIKEYSQHSAMNINTDEWEVSKLPDLHFFKRARPTVRFHILFAGSLKFKIPKYNRSLLESEPLLQHHAEDRMNSQVSIIILDGPEASYCASSSSVIYEDWNISVDPGRVSISQLTGFPNSYEKVGLEGRLTRWVMRVMYFCCSQIHD